MKKTLLAQFSMPIAAMFLAVSAMTAQGASVAIDDFETDLEKVSELRTGWEAKGSELSTATILKISDAQRGGGAGEVTFDVKPGGWALVQKKVGGSDWLKRQPKSISFWLKGGGAGKMEVELEESYTFKWRKEVPLTNKDWHLVTIKLSEFTCPDKKDMSPADLVVFKFVGLSGALKFVVDDIQVECAD